MHSLSMEGRDLLKALMDRDGLNSNSLAVRLRNKSLQSHVYRYLHGIARQPKRETLQPIADHFGVPLAAFYDVDVADQIAVERGLVPGGTPRLAKKPGSEAEQLAAAIELITKALMNSDEFTRGLVRHSLSRLGLDSPESGNIPQKIADLLVTKSSGSAERHDPPRPTGTTGVLVGGSAHRDLSGGKEHGRSDRDAGPGEAQR